MSTQWDNKETFGEWISKEVYFQDGWPCVIRDPINKWVSITDKEIEAIWDADTTPDDTTGSLYYAKLIIRKAESKLKDKNNG